MNRVLILADHAWRDIPGLSAVRAYLEKLNPEVDCRIVDIHLFADSVELFKPHLVLINHLHDRNRNKIVDTVRRRGGLCVVLPTEGRPNSTALLDWATTSWPAQLCDLYLSWSEVFASHLPASVDRAVTGCPRFDFYFLPFTGLVNSKTVVCSQYGLDPNKKIVTVASSFPHAKFALGGGEFIQRDWENLGITKLPGREDAVKVARDVYRAMQDFKAHLYAISRDADTQILIKPHPAEDVRSWMTFCDEIGAKMMLTDYVFNLFSVSDIHVARAECLTLVEASIRGIDTDTFLAQDETYYEGPIHEVIVGDRKAYVEKWIGPMPGASGRVANEISALLDKKKPKTYAEPTAEDFRKFHSLLVGHNRQYAVPQADYVGQYGKAVRLDETDRWTRGIASVIG